MTTVYDPENWLVSVTRAIGAYTLDALQAIPEIDHDIQVEMSFPDTRDWTKETPLSKALVHFELDDEDDPILGFGTPGVSVLDLDAGTETIIEAALHLLNYDVGIWVSAEMGGTTKRMQIKQALKNLFATVTGRLAFNAATEGLWIVSFDGGSDVLDRVNDIPVWRTTGMTMIVKAFSKHGGEAVYLPITEQHQELTIDDGAHVITDDAPWT